MSEKSLNEFREELFRKAEEMERESADFWFPDVNLTPKEIWCRDMMRLINAFQRSQSYRPDWQPLSPQKRAEARKLFFEMFDKLFEK